MYTIDTIYRCVIEFDYRNGYTPDHKSKTPIELITEKAIALSGKVKYDSVIVDYRRQPSHIGYLIIESLVKEDVDNFAKEIIEYIKLLPMVEIFSDQ